MNALPKDDADDLQDAITKHQQIRPQDRTFKLMDPQGQQLWVKTPSKPRLRWLYTITNKLMVWCHMPYFQAPPHAGGPGGVASLQIEKRMLVQLKHAGVPVPEVVASKNDWIALSSVGEKNLDELLEVLPAQERLLLWQQAVQAIAHVHAQGCFLSQCFARNMLLTENSDRSNSQKTTYQIYFLDFEEDPSAVMTLSQAQLRDWALFLHSTAGLITPHIQDCQLFLRQCLQQEKSISPPETQQLFKQLARLRFLKRLQWLGRDGVRLYQLGLFAQGVL